MIKPLVQHTLLLNLVVLQGGKVATNDQCSDTGILEIIELLGRESPPTALDEVVRRAEESGLRGVALSRIVRARDIGRDIHALLRRRRQREAAMSALADTARDLAQPVNVETLLTLLTRRARLLLGMDMSWVALHDHEHGCPRVLASDGHATAVTAGFVVPVGSGISHHGPDESGPFWTSDYLQDRTFSHSATVDEAVRAEGLKSIAAAPLRLDSSSLGTLYVADRNVYHFSPEELSLLASLADLAAVTVEKALLFQLTKRTAADVRREASRDREAAAAAQSLQEVHYQLLSLATENCDLDEFTDVSAGVLEGAVLVRDGAGRSLAAAGTLPALEDSDLQSALLAAHAERRPVMSSRGVWLAPVSAEGNTLGSLVVAPGKPLTSSRARLLHTVADITALLLRPAHGELESRSRMRDEFFGEMLHSSGPLPRHHGTSARSLLSDLKGPHVVVAARPEAGRPGERIATWAAMYARRREGLQSTVDDLIVLLLPGAEPAAAAESVSGELSTVIGGRVTTGSAGPVEHSGDVLGAYREARRCLDAVSALGGTGSSASLQELGFLGLLLSETPNTGEFIATTIGPVLDYDAQQCTELVRTVEAYFAASASHSRTAELLHVHPNTVARRLERVSALLGDNWRDPARALEIQLALRLRAAYDAIMWGSGLPGP